MNTNRLGNNIKAVRVAYGETQEKLGYVIGVEKNTVSSYETGRTEPSNDILEKISKHYMISVEELISTDLSKFKKIDFEIEKRKHYFEIILPIIEPTKEDNSIHLKNAIQYHKQIFKWFVSDESEINYELCINEYEKAFNNRRTKVLAAANLLSVLYLLEGLPRMAGIMFENNPAVLQGLINENPALKRSLSDEKIAMVKEDVEDVKKDPQINEIIYSCIKVLKNTKKWAALGDYYLALGYIFDFPDNDLSYEMNRRIGFEMLSSLVYVDNRYAAQFILLD